MGVETVIVLEVLGALAYLARRRYRQARQPALIPVESRRQRRRPPQG